MSSTAIILAAGKSTRMKSRKPKALHEVCGRPMLDYVLRACYDAGCEQCLVVVGHGKEEVIAAVRQRSSGSTGSNKPNSSAPGMPRRIVRSRD